MLREPAGSGVRVLRWLTGFDGPWGAEGEAAYRAGGYDGLSLVSREPVDLEFLPRLPGLRFLNVSAKVADDRVAFEIDTIEDLTLLTGSRQEIPAVVNANLRRLVLLDRKGLRVAGRWPALEFLRVGQWRGEGLAFVEGAAALAVLRLEGRRQEGTLDGTDGCGRLAELAITRYSVADTAGLRNLVALRELELVAAKPSPAHRKIDLADIRSDGLRKMSVINAARVESPEVLSRFGQLREALFVDCRIPDDVAALPRVTVR